MYSSYQQSFHMLIIETRARLVSFKKRFPRESIFDLRSAKLRLPNGIYSLSPSDHEIELIAIQKRYIIDISFLFETMNYINFVDLIPTYNFSYDCFSNLNVSIWVCIFYNFSTFQNEQGTKSRWEDIQYRKCCFENKSNTKCRNTTFFLLHILLNIKR